MDRSAIGCDPLTISKPLTVERTFSHVCVFRDQPQTFRRGGSTRHSSDGWRRSRGDDDENGNEQTQEPSSTANGSSAWNSRGGQTKRGAAASMEQRTKSNDKWNHGDDRSGRLRTDAIRHSLLFQGHSNSYESNQPRGATGSGWRANGSTASDRDSQAHRSQPKRDRTSESVRRSTPPSFSSIQACPNGWTITSMMTVISAMPRSSRMAPLRDRHRFHRKIVMNKPKFNHTQARTSRRHHPRAMS